MGRSYMNFIAIREAGEVEKYKAQTISDIVQEKDDYNNPFISITQIGLSSSDENEYIEV